MVNTKGIMKSITNLEDAYGLPEKSRLELNETQSNGQIVITPSFRKIVAVELEDDTLLYFQDKDGRMMGIDYDSDGAFKYEVF